MRLVFRDVGMVHDVIVPGQLHVYDVNILTLTI